MHALIAIRQALAFIVESFGRMPEPPPARVAAEAPPRRIRVKPGRSILRRYRPQTWAQACYQFAAEHDGLHAWPKIGWERVRQAVIEPRPGGEVLLTIELNRSGADRWQGWRFAADGRVYEQWGGASGNEGRNNQPEG